MDRPTLDALSRWNRWGTATLDPRIPRDVTSKILPFLETPETVALVGPRRAGKTTVMFQLMDALEHAGVTRDALLHVNLEEPAFQPTLGIDLLDGIYRTFREQVFPVGRGWLFLDEIQRVPEWERWVRTRTETEEIKVFLTGSSSALMSRELGTLLTGRHVQFPVRPLGFSEFLRFKEIPVPARPNLAGTPASMQHALGEYLRWGGFPEVALADDERRKEALLKQYLDDVLFKDVAMRHEVRDVPTLRSLAVLLLTQTASLVSFQRIARTLGISLELSRNYCGYLREAFLVELLPYFSLKATERNRNPQKVHAIDLGLRNAVCLTGSPDRGRLAETAVFGELARRGVDLYYWKGKGEVDFLCRRGNRTDLLVQVSEGVDDPNVLDREIRALEESGRVYRRARRTLVVGRASNTTDQLTRDIEVVPLWRFLLGEGDS